MIVRILEITVPVFGLIAVGYLYAWFRPADMTTANRLNVNLFIPALLFYVLSEQLGGHAGLGDAALGATVIVLGSGLLAWPIARLAGWDLRTVIPPIMFNNAGNLGLPLAVFAFGQHALPIAVVLLVVENALQFTVGLFILSRRIDLRELLGNPMVLATAVGVAAMTFDWHAPAIILPGIKMLGDVAIPLMLVALGVRLTEVDLSHWRIGTAVGLLGPATGLAIAAVWVLIARPAPMVAGLLILFGALPPAVLNYILSEHYQQQPAQVASIVALGNILALVIIPLVLPLVI